MTDAKKPREVSAEMMKLGQGLQPMIKIDPSTGVAVADECAFYYGADDGVQVAMKTALDHLGKQTHALTLATGLAAVDAFKANKGLDKVTLRVPFEGKNAVEIGVQRERVSGVPGSDKTVTTHCAVTPKIDLYATRPRGELAHIKDHLATLATKAYGKK